MAMNQLEQQKSNFLKKLSEETGLTKNKIKRILAEQEIINFDPKKKSTYRSTVLAYSGAYKRVEKAMGSAAKPDPCPMPGCDGHKVQPKNGNWICTVGGNRHYWAMFVARATGNEPSEVLITLTDMKRNQEAKDKEAREKWLKEMNSRNE